MASVPWPFACPRTWSEKAQPNLVRTNMEEGYPKVRARFTKAWAEIQVSFILDWSQKQAVDDFLAKDCVYGTVPFTIADPFTGKTRLVRWKDMPTIAGSPDTKPTFTLSGTVETVFS